MDDNAEKPDEFLVSDRFVNRRDGSTLAIQVSLPQRRLHPQHGEYWDCKYQLTLDGVAKSSTSNGSSWMQALLLAYTSVTKIIKPLDEDWETSDRVPAWVTIPQLVPIGWNYDFYAKIIRYIEHEDSEMNAAIEARRSAKSRRKPKEDKS